jgi:hypothetical protein
MYKYSLTLQLVTVTSCKYNTSTNTASHVTVRGDFNTARSDLLYVRAARGAGAGVLGGGTIRYHQILVTLYGFLHFKPLCVRGCSTSEL